MENFIFCTVSGNGYLQNTKLMLTRPVMYTPMLVTKLSQRCKNREDTQKQGSLLRLKATLKSLRLKPATLLKKRLWPRCFQTVNFVKFLRTPFLQNTSGRQLLDQEKARLILISKLFEWFLQVEDTVLCGLKKSNMKHCCWSFLIMNESHYANYI